MGWDKDRDIPYQLHQRGENKQNNCQINETWGVWNKRRSSHITFAHSHPSLFSRFTFTSSSVTPLPPPLCCELGLGYCRCHPQRYQQNQVWYKRTSTPSKQSRGMGNGELRSVHNSSSLLLLTPHTLHQLQPGAFPWVADSLRACPPAPQGSLLGPKRHPCWGPGGPEDPPDLILSPRSALAARQRFALPSPAFYPRALTCPPMAEGLSRALCWGRWQCLVNKLISEFFIPDSPVPEALHRMR